jgi:hypothetical protein
MRRWTLLVVLVTLLMAAMPSPVAAADDLAPAEVFGEVVYVPFPMEITLDGEIDDWEGVPEVYVDRGPMTSPDPAENGSFSFRVAASSDMLYVLMTMPDQTIIAGQHGAETYQEDSLELFVNLTDTLDVPEYGEGIHQVRVSPLDIGNTDPAALSVTGINGASAGATGIVFETEDGWGAELGIPLREAPEHGGYVGFGAQANGASTTSGRDVQLVWSLLDIENASWQNPSYFGTAIFFEIGQTEIPETPHREIAERSFGGVPDAINVNQAGYFTGGPKLAVASIASDDPVAWILVNGAGYVVDHGRTTVFGRDLDSGQNVHLIDFSDTPETGEGFELQTSSLTSRPFAIDDGIYATLGSDALRYFTLNRSGIELTEDFAGEWARPAGHRSDAEVTCYQGLDAGENYWEGCDYVLDAAGGWYDAGDYGKYVVNGGISAWTLLFLYEQMGEYYPDGSLALPAAESDNGVSDLLDEARWEIEFLLSMQVPEGQPQAGMAHHKLHSMQWDPIPFLPPTEMDNDLEHTAAGAGRYLFPPTTAATLNLAAVGAQCARVFEDVDPAFAEECLVAAERAWEAAQANPKAFLEDPVPGNGGGDYYDGDVGDEFFWAAAELFTTTGDQAYLDAVRDSRYYLTVSLWFGPMDWGHTATLGTLTLATVPNDLDANELAKAQEAIVDAADFYLLIADGEGYGMPLFGFPWGSNAAVLNTGILLGVTHDLTGEAQYLETMVDVMDYLLGRNPLNFSYVTGYGSAFVQHPHHRFWANRPDEGWPAPPPGVVAGGANESADDTVAVAAELLDRAPAARYIDDIEAYSTNEVTINWNAPLAWVATYLNIQYGGAQPAAADTSTTTTTTAPAATATTVVAAEDEGDLTWLPWTLGGIALVLLAGGAVLLLRRREAEQKPES